MLHAARTPPRLGTLVLLTALSVLSLNMFLPSLSNMAVDFEADYSIVALAIAGYLGITGLLMLIAGPMSDRFGRRPILLGGVTFLPWPRWFASSPPIYGYFSPFVSVRGQLSPVGRFHWPVFGISIHRRKPRARSVM
jgi:MFS family permease